jgi:hypothetical protein
LRTLHLGPHEILAVVSLDFRDHIPSEQIEATVTGLERQIRVRFPDVRRVYIEAQSREGHLALADRPQGEAEASRT